MAAIGYTVYKRDERNSQECTEDKMTEHRSYSDGEQALIDAGWPPALAKATEDSFQYAVQVRDVGVIVFESAEPVGTEWVRLFAGQEHGCPCQPPVEPA